MLTEDRSLSSGLNLANSVSTVLVSIYQSMLVAVDPKWLLLVIVSCITIDVGIGPIINTTIFPYHMSTNLEYSLVVPQEQVCVFGFDGNNEFLKELKVR